MGYAVHGMEEAMKQVIEIQEWINVHNALAKDWLANPSKLRPEAAKQDMAAMSDALVSLGEKRNRILTEIPTEGETIYFYVLVLYVPDLHTQNINKTKKNKNIF